MCREQKQNLCYWYIHQSCPVEGVVIPQTSSLQGSKDDSVIHVCFHLFFCLLMLLKALVVQLLSFLHLSLVVIIISLQRILQLGSDLLEEANLLT